MADGIRIHDASVAISPDGLAALVSGTGAEITVSRLDLTISPESLNVLLAGLAPEGAPIPAAEVDDGRLRLSGEREGKRVSVELRVSGLRLQITADGLHLVSE